MNHRCREPQVLPSIRNSCRKKSGSPGWATFRCRRVAARIV